MAGVDVLEVTKRTEQADADVDRAIAGGKDPAVPGKGLAGPVVQIKRRFGTMLVMPGAGPVGTNCGGIGPITCPKGAERPPIAAVGAIGDNDVLGVKRMLNTAGVLHDRTPHEPTLDDRPDGLVPD